MFRVLFQIMLHPGDVFQSIRTRERSYHIPALVALVCLFFVSAAEFQLMDFTFNHNRIDRLNIWLLLFRTIVLFFLWVLANWSFCSLFSGEGRLSQIFWVSAISLMPYILTTLLCTGLSAFLILEEGIFLTWIGAAGKIYSGILIVSGLHIIHNYSFKRTLLSLVCSLLGIAVILFLCMLIFSLFQQFWNFALTIIKELMRIGGGG